MKRRMMITGKNGFVAKNIYDFFHDRGGYDIQLLSHDDSEENMRKMVISSDLIFHTAAVQRSDCEDDYWAGNVLYTKKLISCIHESMKKPVIIYTSTINIDYDTPFSRSKLEAERLLRKCSMEMGLRLYVFKLNNCLENMGSPIIIMLLQHIAITWLTTFLLL